MGQYYKAVIIKEVGNTCDIQCHFKPHDFNNGAKLMEHSYVGNDFVNAVENYLATNKEGFNIVWAGDYANNEILSDHNLYDLCSGSVRIVNPIANENYRYLINLTTKQFVDITKVPIGRYDMTIHPLPLLTCEGNGLGGGDYRGESDLIGSWSRDKITCSNTQPDETFKELIFNLTE